MIMGDSSTISIFTNMFSLLTPYDTQSPWPVSLKLPNIFPQDETSQVQEPSLEKQLKDVTACPHADRKHYAKNMCSRCYHKFGREKLAWVCTHKDRPHYAKGRCQICYLKLYYRRRRY
jgi:hypothetical protein